MSVIDVSGLFNKFNSISDLLITDINATPIEIHYPPIGPLSSNVTSQNVPNTYDVYGGIQPPAEMNNRIGESGSDVYPQERTVTILGRVYWSEKPFSPQLTSVKIEKAQSFCKMNIFTSDSISLQNCIYLIINGRRVEITHKPVPYGFGKRYSCGYGIEV